MRAIAIAVVAVLSLAAVPPQGRGGSAPFLPLSAQWELAARVYFPDGRTVAAFGLPSPTGGLTPVVAEHFVTDENLCVFNAPFRAERASYGWQVTATPLREAPTELVVRVDWRRTFDHRKPVTMPTQSVELTLRPNEGRIPLDYFRPDPATATWCTAVGMALEIRIAR